MAVSDVCAERGEELEEGRGLRPRDVFGTPEFKMRSILECCHGPPSLSKKGGRKKKRGQRAPKQKGGLVFIHAVA